MNSSLPARQSPRTTASPPPNTRQEVNPPEPVEATLLALAPLHLPNCRASRSCSDSLCISLDQLAGRDQQILRHLYASLTEFLRALTDQSTDDAGKWDAVSRWIGQHDLDALIDQVTELGTASRALGEDEARAKAIHDLRGGALSALLGRLQLLDRLTRDENQLKVLFVLTRDHLKIMRSALLGLDDPRRDADRRPKSHDVSLALDKWQDTVVGPHWAEKPIRLHVDCRHEGALTECCLESAAIDRIFYNLVNNASRHSVSHRLDLAIFPVPAAPGESLRFVLSNDVGAGDAASLGTLAQAGGADRVDQGTHQSLWALFEPEVTSTGSGFGLTVVADFVADAFGLPNRRAALRERYVGAILDRNVFRVWFHWPVANDGLPPKLDDYRRPEQSLSEP